MIESVEIENFKGFRHCKVELGRFNLLIGPNGSGKSTFLRAILDTAKNYSQNYFSISNRHIKANQIKVTISWNSNNESCKLISFLSRMAGSVQPEARAPDNQTIKAHDLSVILNQEIDFYALDPSKLTPASQIGPGSGLKFDGSNLAAALDRLRDQGDSHFQSLVREFVYWLPEFTELVFQTPSDGKKSICLRLHNSDETIPLTEASEGTIIALALLTIIHNPYSPTVLLLEEPDRGLHPRLLRNIKDALFRIAFPEKAGIDRPPVQIIATTHNPIFLDLFRDNPEMIMISENDPDKGFVFHRLADQPHLKEILEDTSLGDAWYTGILGGVPAHT